MIEPPNKNVAVPAQIDNIGSNAGTALLITTQPTDSLSAANVIKVSTVPVISTQPLAQKHSMSAGSKCITQRITVIDPKKLQQAGLDRRINESLSSRKVPLKGVRVSYKKLAEASRASTPNIAFKNVHDEATTNIKTEVSKSLGILSPEERLQHTKQLLNQKLLQKLPSKIVQKAAKGETSFSKMPKMPKIGKGETDSQTEGSERLNKLMPIKTPQEIARVLDFSAGSSTKIATQNTTFLTSSSGASKEPQIILNFRSSSEKLQSSKITKEHLSQKKDSHEIGSAKEKPAVLQQQPNTIEVEEDIEMGSCLYGDPQTTSLSINLKKQTPYQQGKTVRKANMEKPKHHLVEHPEYEHLPMLQGDEEILKLRQQQLDPQLKYDINREYQQKLEEPSNHLQHELKHHDELQPHHSQRQHNFLQKMLKRQQIEQLFQDKRKQERKPNLSQDTGVPDNDIHNFLQRCNTPNMKSSTSYTSMSSRCSNDDVIPKASIRTSSKTVPAVHKLVSYRNSSPNFPQVSPLKMHFPTTSLPQEAPLPKMSTFIKPFPLQSPRNVITDFEHSSHQSMMQTNNLIVLEDKVLSQHEKIDLTVFGLVEPKLEPKSELDPDPFADNFVELPLPHVIKEEVLHPAELPVIGATVSTDPQQSLVVVNPMQPRKFIVCADKLRMSKEKIAELAKHIKTQVMRKQQNQSNVSLKVNPTNCGNAQPDVVDPEVAKIGIVAHVAHDEKQPHLPLKPSVLRRTNANPFTLKVKSLHPSSSFIEIPKVGSIIELPSQSNVGEPEANNIDNSQSPSSLTLSKNIPLVGSIVELPSQLNVGEFEAKNMDDSQLALRLTSSKDVPKVGSIIQLSSKVTIPHAFKAVTSTKESYIRPSEYKAFDKDVIDVVSTAIGKNPSHFKSQRSNVLVQPTEKIGPTQEDNGFQVISQAKSQTEENSSTDLSVVNLESVTVPFSSEASSKLPPTSKTIKGKNESTKILTKPKEINVEEKREKNEPQIVSKTDLIKSNSEVNTMETVNKKASASSVLHREATNTTLTSRVARKAPSVCIINEAPTGPTLLSAVDVIAKLPVSKLELSADEQILRSSLAMSFPEIKLTKQQVVVKKSSSDKVIVKQTRSDDNEIDATMLIAQLFNNDNFDKCTAKYMDEKGIEKKETLKINQVVDMKTKRLQNCTTVKPLKATEEQPLQREILPGFSKKQENDKLQHFQSNDTQHKLATNQEQQQSFIERQSVGSDNKVNLVSDLTKEKDNSSEKGKAETTGNENKILKGNTKYEVGPSVTPKEVYNLQSNVGGNHVSRFKKGKINLVQRKRNVSVENVREKDQYFKSVCEEKSDEPERSQVNNKLGTSLQQKSIADDVENTQQDPKNTREKECLPQKPPKEIQSSQDSLNINALEVAKALDLKDIEVETERKLLQKVAAESSANISSTLVETVVPVDLVQLVAEKSIEESTNEPHTVINYQNPLEKTNYIRTLTMKSGDILPNDKSIDEKSNKWQYLGLTEQREQDTEAAKILVSLLQPPKANACNKLKTFPAARNPFKRRSLDVKLEGGSRMGTQNLLHIEDNKLIEELKKDDKTFKTLSMKGDQESAESMFEQNTIGVGSGDLSKPKSFEGELNVNPIAQQIIHLSETNLKNEMVGKRSEAEEIQGFVRTAEESEPESKTKQSDITESEEATKDVNAEDTLEVIAVTEKDQDLKKTVVTIERMNNSPDNNKAKLKTSAQNVSILQTSEIKELVDNTEQKIFEKRCVFMRKSESKEKNCMQSSEIMDAGKRKKRNTSFEECGEYLISLEHDSKIEMIPAVDFEKKVETEDNNVKKRRTCSFIALESSSKLMGKDVKVLETEQNVCKSVETNEHQQFRNNEQLVKQIEDFSVPKVLQTTSTEYKKASSSAVFEELNLEFTQTTAETQSDFEVTDMEYSTREDSNYYEDTGKEESSQEIIKSKTNRKRLRKTFDDIKKGRRANITPYETDSDENDNETHRGIMKRCYYDDDSVEFLGFDETLPMSSELEENLNKLVSVIDANKEKSNKKEWNEKEEKPSAEEGKSTQQAYKPTMGNLKNWLTTGKAGQPPISKTSKTRVFPKIMPLKKRWELAQQQKRVETDVTDDTSPAHDDDGEQTPIKRNIHDLSDEMKPNAEKESYKKIKLSMGKEGNEQENETEIQTEYAFAKPREITELISDASLNDSSALKHLGETQEITERSIETKRNQLEKNSSNEECDNKRTLITESRKGDHINPNWSENGKVSVGEYCQKSSDDMETFLPKKRGRKSKFLVAPVQVNTEKTEVELKDKSHAIPNETSPVETLPKKRGSKPKKFFEDMTFATPIPAKKEKSSKTADVKVSQSRRKPKVTSAAAAQTSTVKEVAENHNNTVIESTAESDNGISDIDHNRPQCKETDHTNSTSSLALVPKRKKRGRKPKTSKAKNLDEFTETQEPKRGETDFNSNANDLSPTVAQPSAIASPVTAIAPKRPGRKPKALSAGTLGLEGTDSANGTRSFNPRLLLVRSRDQLNSDEPLTESAEEPGAESYKCGLCLANITKTKWKAHLGVHYGIGWIHGQTVLNVSSRSTVLSTMINYYKESNVKALNCRICGRSYRSALGLLLHLETCGLSAEELQKNRIECEFCKNKYKRLSYPGHLRTCSARPEQVANKDSTLNATPDVMKSAGGVLNNVGRIKRQSLIRAETKLKEIGQELQSTQDTEFEPEKFVKHNLPVCIADYRQKCSQDMERFGKTFCPQQFCTFTSLDFNGMEKHLKECSLIPKPGHQCTLCKMAKVFKTHELALEHVKHVHASYEQFRDFECDSSDCKIDSESSSDEGASGVNSNKVMTGKHGDNVASGSKKNSAQKTKPKKGGMCTSFIRVQRGSKKQLYPPRTPHTRVNVVKKWEEFTKHNYSDDMLFNYGPTTYILHETHNEIFKKCLPSQQNSMKFAMSEELKISKTFGMPESMDWKQLQCFETISVKKDNFAFIGAPIKAIAWAPLPKDAKAVQFLAIAYRKDVEKFTRSLNPKISPTLILIYEINTKATSLKLHYAVRIPNGPVHCLDFLPSGGYAPAANRLGLLAVGTAGSDIRIYSLPLKVEHEDMKGTLLDEKEERNLVQCLKVVDLKPVFILTLDLSTVCEEDVCYEAPIRVQCTRIKWSEARGHNYIFAGYSNGFVGVWDINDDESENLNLFMVNAKRYFVPINYFFTGERGVRDMALHYDTTGLRWMAVSSYMRKLVVYDLRDLANPLILYEQIAKNIISSLDWPTVWENFSMAMGSAIPNNGECLLVRSPICVNFTQSKIDQMVCGVNQVRYNPWQNVYVSATENGEILFHGMRELHYEVIHKTSAVWKAVATLDVKCLNGSQLPIRSDKICTSLKMFETDYKEKYGLVFNPIIKLSADLFATYKSKERVPPHHILRYMRVNCLSCNLNVGAQELVAYGFENGLVRLLNFERSDYFN